MQIVLNGEAKEISDDATVSSLLASLSLEGRRVAVEINEHVIPKARHAEVRFTSGDRVEIVAFVGGG